MKKIGIGILVVIGIGAGISFVMKNFFPLLIIGVVVTILYGLKKNK